GLGPTYPERPPTTVGRVEALRGPTTTTCPVGAPHRRHTGGRAARGTPERASLPSGSRLRGGLVAASHTVRPPHQPAPRSAQPPAHVQLRQRPEPVVQPAPHVPAAP